MRHILTVTLVVLILALAPGALLAADPGSDAGYHVGYRGWGPRVGVSFEPDQFHGGVHLDFGNFAQHVRFQPNIEAGFGDHLTLVTANFDASYRFRSKWDVWSPYLGGGIGVNFARFDNKGNEAGNDWDTDLGASLLGGIEKGISNGDRFFLEAKVGLVKESPDFMFTIGWTFYH